MDTLSEANGTFAIRLLKILCQDKSGRNVFYSPMSISSALCMILLGAKGNTAVQMAQVSCLSPRRDWPATGCCFLSPASFSPPELLKKEGRMCVHPISWWWVPRGKKAGSLLQTGLFVWFFFFLKGKSFPN